MGEEFSEVTSRSWGERLSASIKGVVFGVILFLVSFPLLYWNEGRAVRTAKSLDEGAASVRSIATDKIDGAHDKGLVHLSGPVAVTELVVDPAFGVSGSVLRLWRKVEMFQWVEEQKKETQKKPGGGEETVTSYVYSKQWRDALIPTKTFKLPAGHQNPESMEYEARDFTARNATLGAFHFPDKLIWQMTKSTPGLAKPYPLEAAQLEKVPSNLRGKVKASSGNLYLGKDPESPEIGDVRVSYQALAPQSVSVVARQVGNSFEPFKTKAGEEILMVDAGTKDAATMFKTAETQSAQLTWILRAVGYVLMAIGIGLVLRPIATVADFIPSIGSFVGAGTAFFGALLAAPLTLCTVAVAWVAARPWIGGILFGAMALGLGALGYVMVRAKRSRKAAR